MTTIESTRFGPIEVGEETLYTFPDGLIGLPGTRYFVLSPDQDSPFLWLHSAEHADVAVPVTTPWLFHSTYEVRVLEEDARQLELEKLEEAHILAVVRAVEQPADSTINLAAPVVLNPGKRLGRQIFNQAGGYSVRCPLFAEVELSDSQLGDKEPPAAHEPVQAAAS